MPRAKSERSLQRIVIRCANTILLQDVPGVRELRVQRMRTGRISRVYVGHDIQLASLAPHVADLEYGGMPQAFFHLPAVVEEIRRAEILVYRIRRESAI